MSKEDDSIDRIIEEVDRTGIQGPSVNEYFAHRFTESERDEFALKFLQYAMDLKDWQLIDTKERFLEQFKQSLK